MKTSKSTNRTIDATDCDIIQLLQEDGRVTNIEIARKLGVSGIMVR